MSGKLILRLLWVPIGAIFLFSLLSQSALSLNNVLYGLTEDSYEIYVSFQVRELIVWAFFVVVAAAHLILELFAHFNDRIARSRILTHFRYGPAAITLVWIVAVTIFDVTMIEVSRLTVSSYVHNGASRVEEPYFGYLHNTDRGWCGNGASATYEALYYSTASAGLRDPDPFVRARSFLASAKVRDFLNGSPQFRADTVTLCRDESELVRQTLEEHLSRSKSSCDKVLAAEASK